MKGYRAAAAVVLLSISAQSAVANDQREQEKLDRALNGGFDVAALLDDGYRISAMAPVAGDQALVYLQKEREAARCVVDVAAGTESCTPLTTGAREIERRFEARDAVVGFFREKNCSVSLGGADEEEIKAYFEELGYRERDLEQAAGLLVELGALKRVEDRLELVQGCE